MLDPVNLDDMTYEQLIKAADINIEEWSDRNAHDPGIMLIELFAWLTEMQRFYINQTEFAIKPVVHSAAFTMGDYEKLVSCIPGVEYVRSYQTGRHNVSIAVSGQVDTGEILEYLEPYRMIGTALAIESPHYVKLRITAEVVGQPFREDIKPIVERELKEYFLENFNGFGAHITVDRVTAFMSSLDVIYKVLALEINAEGFGVKRDYSGNVEMSPRSILSWEGLELYVR